MKKLSMFQIILLVFFGASAVAGVLIFSLAIGGSASKSVGPVKIWGALDKGAFSAVLRQATESNGALSQVSYDQKDPATYEAELTDALASGTGPDLFLLRQDYAVKDQGKVAVIPISALSKSQFESAFIEAANPFMTQVGALGVPVFADPLVLYWNKDLLASAGFAQPPKHWDELFNMAVKITKKNDAGQILKSAIAFGEYRNVNNAKDVLATLILQAGGTITTMDSGDHLVPGLIPKGGGNGQSTETALRFYTQFADPSKANYSWNRSLRAAQEAFAAGDVGLYVGYASEYPQIARGNPNLNFAVAAIPQTRSTAGSLNTAHVYAFAAARAGKNPSAAVQAAYLLAASDNGKALTTALGIPSARRDVANSMAHGVNTDADTNDALFSDMAIIAKSWIDPDPEKTAIIFRDMIEKTTSGAQLLTEAVQRADQELGHILGL